MENLREKMKVVDSSNAQWLSSLKENIILKRDDIQKRLIELAVEIIRLCSSLNKTMGGRIVAKNLLNTGIASVYNYVKSCGNERKRYPVRKPEVVLKRLNESFIWLEIVRRNGMVPAYRLNPVLNEGKEISRIIRSRISEVESVARDS